MVEIKELTAIEQRETGFVASFTKEDKSSISITIEDLKANLEQFKLEINDVDDVIAEYTDEMSSIQDKIDLEEEKRNALKRSIVVLENFFEGLPVEEAPEVEEGSEEESVSEDTIVNEEAVENNVNSQ